METWDYQGEWLNQFPQNTRSTIMNLFCYAVRDGHDRALLVIQHVEYQLLRRKGPRNDSCLTNEWIDKVIAALVQDEAKEVAEHVLWRERLPDETKKRLKASKGVSFMFAKMEQEEPSEPQLKYLVALGCSDKPKTKKEASDLIEIWIAKKKKKKVTA
jgi:hypothetical protein